jgi:hypothetical protein
VSAVTKPNLGSALTSTKGTRSGNARSDVSGADIGGTELDAKALRALSEEISHQFAPQLEHTALLLYDRDPEHLQVQWYVTPEDLAGARGAFPGSGADLCQVLHLRRLDEDGRAHVVASTRQGGTEPTGVGHADFALQGDGAEYECELGLESDRGGWLVLVRSNRVMLPARRFPPPPRPGASSRDSEVQGGPRKVVENWKELEDRPVEAALAAVGHPLPPVFPRLESDVFPAPRDSLSANERILGGTDAWNRKLELGSGAVPQPGLELRTASADSQEGSWAAMPPPLLPSWAPRGRSPDLLDTFYDPRAALSSAAVRGTRTPLSEMDIQVELVVQGHAAPGSVVELFGHRLPVGDDGRFYVRRPIEDPRLLELVVRGRPLPGPGDPEPE